MVRLLKKLEHSLIAIGLSVVFGGFAAVSVAYYFTPDRYQVVEGNRLSWSTGAISAQFENPNAANKQAIADKSYRATLMLFDTIPVKTVYVDVVDDSSVMLCGTPFGIKLYTNGVMVVGMADIQTDNQTVNPALTAGLKVGDIILEVNGTHVNQYEEVAREVEQNAGKPLSITYKRNNTVHTATVQPVRSHLDNLYKVGLWVRDSTAGIGTLTFYDPIYKSFAGLGHGICDTDTNELMPLLNGDIVPVSINGVVKGKRGSPGELRGYFSTNISIGTLTRNVQEGVYGSFDSPAQAQQFVQKPVHVAMKQDVHAGSAQILTTIDGGKAQYYNVEIQNLNYHNSSNSKDMILRVTDERLLSATGGIVQGMSGSPIVQNGKLIGAVTHVFVNDPTCGYGIYAQNMLTVSKQVCSSIQEKAS